MKRLAFAGFVIWLVATLALRAGGQWIITPDRAASIAVLLALSMPVMFALPRRLFARFSIAPEDYARGAIALVAPGMALDTISAIWFPWIFPNMRPDAAGFFGGWLLLCNVVALLSAALAQGTSPPQQRDGDVARAEQPATTR
jgi:hypothetical protein